MSATWCQHAILWLHATTQQQFWCHVKTCLSHIQCLQPTLANTSMVGCRTRCGWCLSSVDSTSKQPCQGIQHQGSTLEYYVSRLPTDNPARIWCINLISVVHPNQSALVPLHTASLIWTSEMAFCKPAVMVSSIHPSASGSTSSGRLTLWEISWLQYPHIKPLCSSSQSTRHHQPQYTAYPHPRPIAI